MMKDDLGFVDDLNIPEPTHVAYADESRHNTGRYRAVALVTLSIADAQQVNKDLQAVWQKLNITEFKWAKLKSAQYRFAAARIVDHVMSWIDNQIARIDVVTWDTEDSRHTIRNRSDMRNLRRMYYFLARNVLARRWPSSSVWELRADESSLDAAGHFRYLGNPDELNEDARKVAVARAGYVHSHQEPLVQVADFFAGMAAYSRNSYQTYEIWMEQQNSSQASAKLSGLSNSHLERCPVLEYLYRCCKERKLRVSLVSNRGLRTMDARSPLNFWWYEPQGDYDRAPIWH
jgi:hypothetical protein